MWRRLSAHLEKAICSTHGIKMTLGLHCPLQNIFYNILRHLLCFGFLGISNTGAALLKDVECAVKIEAVHECSSYAWEIMDVAIDTPDDRPYFETAWLPTYPDKLLGVCKTD